MLHYVTLDSKLLVLLEPQDYPVVFHLLHGDSLVIACAHDKLVRVVLLVAVGKPGLYLHPLATELLLGYVHAVPPTCMYVIGWRVIGFFPLPAVSQLGWEFSSLKIHFTALMMAI